MYALAIRTLARYCNQKYETPFSILIFTEMLLKAILTHYQRYHYRNKIHIKMAHIKLINPGTQPHIITAYLSPELLLNFCIICKRGVGWQCVFRNK